MKKNMGTADRIIRTAIALILLALVMTKHVQGTLAVVLGVVGVVFLITSAVGVCPGYLPMKISTCKAATPAQK